MSDTEAREWAWVAYPGGDFKYPSTAYRHAFMSGWDAAMAHAFEPCGVPTEPGNYLIDRGAGWKPIYITRRDLTSEWWQTAKGFHWRRLRMPPAPEDER